MCFHVCPQTFCLYEYRVTLMAFVSYFSAVCFQMSPQISGLKRGIVTLHWLHLFNLSPLCVFKCLLKELGSEQQNSHWLHLFDFSPLCVNKCVLKWCVREKADSHWLHLWGFSPLCIFKCILKLCA